MVFWRVSAIRPCRVTVNDADEVAHSVEVSAASLYEAEAAALRAFRAEDWAADALTPNAMLRVEVQLPPVVHDVPVCREKDVHRVRGRGSVVRIH
jgi:hypothetical protein